MTDPATEHGSWQQSQRMAQVQTPVIPLLGQMIAAHPGSISLGQGVANYGPPEQVMQRIKQLTTKVRFSDLHGYGLVAGIEPLLDLIKQKLADDNQITVNQHNRCVVTAGANMGFLNAVMAITDPGDQIVIQSPYYFNHEMAIGMVDCQAVAVPTDRQYQLDLAAIESALTKRTRAVVTISPNNPTGAVYDGESLKAVNQLCKSRGIYHISDEAYEYFTYGDTAHYSPASDSQSAGHTISLFSLSKAYGMAGWRIGYMVIPAQLEQAVKKIQDTNLICPPLICQHAAVAALEIGSAYCTDKVARLDQVRRLVIDKLDVLGDRIDAPRPDGAFYVMARLDTEIDDMELIGQLIKQFGVAVMPGSTFGVDKPRCIRIAYGALDKDTVSEAMQRLGRGLDALL